jgi:hypothetical protein
LIVNFTQQPLIPDSMRCLSVPSSCYCFLLTQLPLSDFIVDRRNWRKSELNNIYSHSSDATLGNYYPIYPTVGIHCRSDNRYRANILNTAPVPRYMNMYVYRHFHNVNALRFVRPLLYKRVDIFWPVSFTVSAWEWVYATNLSRLQRETSKRHVGEAHSVLITATLLPQRLICYWGRIVSPRTLADLRLTTAQQRTTGQNLLSDL